MKAPFSVRVLRGFALIFVLTISAVPPLNMSAQEIGPSVPGKQRLAGHVPKEVARLRAVGTLPATTNLQLAISLPLRNTPALSNLLNQIYNPASPNYRHYLTPRQFTAQFGPSVRDYNAVIKFARNNGLRVATQFPNRLVLDVTGSVADIQRVLHTTLRTYQHPTENRLFYAPDTDPSVDLSVPILHIDGLDNYSLPRPRLKTIRLSTINYQPSTSSSPSPNAGSGPSGTYMGKDFRAAYVPDTTLTGSGQVVGLLQFDGYTPSDITYYESKNGLPNVPLQNVLIDGASGNPSGSGGEVEVSLDIEMSMSMAPGLSKIIVYEGTYSFVDIFNRMATDNQAKQLSCSWYIPGGTAEPAADQIFQEMAAQGQSFFNASGDSDAYTGLIDFPGDTPYITQVGGTTLTTSGTNGSWVSETVWNWGGGTGSGGGISTQYPIPSYQTNISMTANQGSTTMRNTPDVALTADNVYVRADGSDIDVGGTSCAAPLWAGFSALVNQEAVASGHSTIGFVNPLIDAIGTGQSYGTAFHDIITGNNEWSGSPTKFSAVAGYDLCTGWGTPSGQHLIDALANPEALIISPLTGFTAIGGFGGPFSVTSENLSLTNSGTNTFTWTLVNTSSWLKTSSSSGTLSPGGPATIVTFGLNNTASNLPVGNYTATIWFTNLNDNFGQSRQFTLDVISPPSITSQPTNQAVLDGATATFSAGVTGGLPLSYQWQFNGTNLVDGGNITGSATTTLIISNASTDNVGAYDLVATNYAGMAVSSNALLSLIPSAPIITLEPSNETIGVNQTAQFAVIAVGTKPFSYQWSFNTTNINGATNATLVLTGVQFSQAGEYSVTVSNIYGVTDSTNATLTVLPCDPDPVGLVDWWRAEGDATDTIGVNNGTLEGTATFAPGEVGQAFSFDGVSGYVLIPDSPSLDSFSNSMTIECWIKSGKLTANSGWEGLVCKGNSSWRLMGTSGANTVYVAFDGASPMDLYGTRNVNDDQWHHIAATYDGSTMALYVDGTLDVSEAATGSIIHTSDALTIGDNAGQPGLFWNGLIDEVSLYNRALSSNEIAEIYAAGASGKCFTPVLPSITAQPTNQTVFVGGTAIFSVTAAGTPPLYYQWNFDGTNIAGATNATLTLNGVQFNQAGNYAVSVTSLYGSTNSTTATLTVNPAPPCDPPPYGLVDWWRAEGDADDSIGTNNGVLDGTVGFAPGEVDQAFSFDGSGYVSVPDAPSLDLSNSMTVELWVKANSTALNADWEGLVCKGNTSWRLQATTFTNTVTFSASGLSTQDLFGTRNINDGQWHHVAGVYDGSTMYLYVDGTLDVSQPSTGTIAQNSLPLAIGNNDQSPAGHSYFFNGLIDEVSLYNRALSADEIGAIYATGPGGKCPSPPSIITEPSDQTAFVGGAAAFSVVAVGAQPLSYQWNFSGTNIVGATNTSLTLTNVQFSQAGNYAVVITNPYGSTNSTTATLTVNTPPPCDPAPSGLVDWWRAEGDAIDSIGTNNGTLEGSASFAPGEVGQAFSFDGSSGYVSVPDAPLLDSFTNSMTIECWIKSGKLTANSGWEGLVCKGNYSWRLMGTSQANTLYVAFDGVSPTDLYGTINVNDEQWHHIAATYDGSTMSLYVDGTLDVSQPASGSVFQSSDALTIGNNAGQPGLFWNGLIDEVSLYNRALSADEIAAIYAAGPAGKCPPPPSIISEPANQTAFVGSTATFSVTAQGTQPLFYQWSFNSTNILDATNATLTLTNVQFREAGDYTVAITNPYGSTNSTPATLTVNPLPPCDPAPSGLVNWWRGEGNAADSIGMNNGSLEGTASFAPGEVGQAFSFDGYSGYVLIPDAPSLDSFSNSITIEAWVKASSLASTNADWEGIVCKGNTSWRLQATSGANTVNFSATGLSSPDLFGTRNINDGQWHHVAGVYDGGTMYLYVDGTLDVSQPSTGTITQNNIPLAIGNNTQAPYGNYYFDGMVDEVSLYNRPLSPDEIAAIYAAGPSGKCPAVPPSIIAEPMNQTAFAGNTATISVAAVGMQPLFYQWNLNGTNIPGANNATLILTNVQLSQAGNYAVSITNLYGSTNSTTATLTVNPPTGCDPPPAGIVDWWRAEGNATDTIGTNNGTLHGTASFVPGEVGEAFSFDGSSGYVLIPDSPPLDAFTNAMTIECWIKSGKLTVNSGWEGLVCKGNSSWRLMGTSGANTVYVAFDGASTDLFGTRNVNDEQWHHVAATYNGNTIALYVDGTLDVSQPATGSMVHTGDALTIGDNAGQPNLFWNGLIDEVSLYNRALTSNEIAAIYSAGSSGKCVFVPPFITSQPTNQAVVLGNTAALSVIAGGTLPLSYQWTFNSNSIAGGTNATLFLTNVQFANAGSYSVMVTNAYGSILSSNAILAVAPNYSFAWNPIPSPRFVNTPFTVTIQAVLTNGVDTNFNGTVVLTSTNGVPVNPTISSSFSQGVWNGSITISRLASNVVLQATDVHGVSAAANPINIVALPSLSSGVSGNTFYIEWPVSPSGFALETASALNGSWVPVGGSPINIGGEYLQQVPISGTNAFYRLRFTGP